MVITNGVQTSSLTLRALFAMFLLDVDTVFLTWCRFEALFESSLRANHQQFMVITNGVQMTSLFLTALFAMFLLDFDAVFLIGCVFDALFESFLRANHHHCQLH